MFEFNFTLEKLASCIKRNHEPELWYNILCEYLPHFDIVTEHRVAGFISQCQHESVDFIELQENLNYGVKGLLNTFGKYFKDEAMASFYARKPEMIANHVYADRMGNGPESSGDGWLYRGRGLIHITGKETYAECSQALFQNDILLTNPELLTTPEYAVLSSCWFWNKKNLNLLCDVEDVVLLTKRVNGGLNGLAERKEFWEYALDKMEEQ